MEPWPEAAALKVAEFIPNPYNSRYLAGNGGKTGAATSEVL